MPNKYRILLMPSSMPIKLSMNPVETNIMPIWGNSSSSAQITNSPLS